MAESSNVSSPIVQEGVNGHVSQLPNGHVSQLSNGDVSQLPNGHSPRERLVAMLYREVSADIRKDDGDVTLGLLERLRLENVEKAVRLRLMMKETEVKIAEKNISIRRLRRNGDVGVNLLLEAALKYVGVCGFLEVVVDDDFFDKNPVWRRDLETEGGRCVRYRIAGIDM
ncbi:hypothetical protein Tco_0998507 [Tanacetum coccineum]